METDQFFIKTTVVETQRILCTLTERPAPSWTEPAPKITSSRKNDPAFFETDKKANEEKQKAKTQETPQTSHAPKKHKGRERGTRKNLPLNPRANSGENKGEET